MIRVATYETDRLEKGLQSLRDEGWTIVFVQAFRTEFSAEIHGMSGAGGVSAVKVWVVIADRGDS
jgi:hypothetical protein